MEVFKIEILMITIMLLEMWDLRRIRELATGTAHNNNPCAQIFQMIPDMFNSNQRNPSNTFKKAYFCW
jgi:hypothetical protein